jgi:hypothetical protein
MYIFSRVLVPNFSTKVKSGRKKRMGLVEGLVELGYSPRFLPFQESENVI